ncbi:hypothetical protein [Blastococcus brunescens]|uniref:Transketolase C-terminal domain-containing protein n=1 Tax=Blastococcus brunescens TaxID=1564165 RepID=A0ABZ1B4Z7_9ACTN|nr:hypothetical protein [Blastococcus sp. BMG 8361]WRL65447.1 hypothetical protein U6N30_07450 [Blastococcus sp. BMG 8361]
MVAELLGSKLPRRLLRLGIEDRYGESGAPREVLEFFGLTGRQLAGRLEEFTRTSRAVALA